MSDNGTALGRSPLYVVLFSATDVDASYFPIVAAPLERDSTVTVPHGFDRNVAPALPGLWYCLHLPNTFFELIDISAVSIKAAQALHLDHHILLMPIEIFDQGQLGRWRDHDEPVLVVCPDDLLEETARRSETLGFALPPAGYSQLSNDSLQAHWRAIHAQFVPNTPYLGREPTLTRRLDFAPADLPRRWLMRQFGSSPDNSLVADGDPNGVVAHAVWSQLLLAATARLEREHTEPDIAETLIPKVIEEERHRLRIPVVLALPGVAPAYARGAYDSSLRKRIEPFAAVDEADTWSVTMHQRTDSLVERAAIEFVATHQAIARGGIGLMLPTISPEGFTILAQLERHFEGPTQSGSTVWRLLERLDAATQAMWSDALVRLVACAATLTVFSNFPIGLLRLPGDTSPLSARVPIAYRPLLPLTRAVQTELAYVPAIDLTAHLRVLVAECIPVDDPVGPASRAGWRVAADHVRTAGERITMDIVETLSVDALRGAIADNRPDVLIISAHGVLAREHNIAGLKVGTDVLLGPGFGPLPPVVILSACHVAPRGAGTVSVTDLLLREGAVAVLGTQVPVDVTRNAMLMMRFLLYITEVLAGREDHSTLLDVWHRVQTSNAVNDVLSGSPSLHRWGRSPAASGLPVIQEFMAVRSTGQLRRGHIYADTERILAEIADGQDIGARVRNWFRRPGYVPESLFYVFAGRPDRIYLRPLVKTVQDLVS
jgi:hypothetical protein